MSSVSRASQGGQGPAWSGSQAEVHEDRLRGSCLGLGRLVCRRHQGLDFTVSPARDGGVRENGAGGRRGDWGGMCCGSR